MRDNTAATAAGGISNFDQLTLRVSNVSGNTAGDRGGGIFNGVFMGNTGSLTLENSEVTKNTAGVDGGGIYNDGGSVTLTNSRVIKNSPNDCVGC